MYIKSPNNNINTEHLHNNFITIYPVHHQVCTEVSSGYRSKFETRRVSRVENDKWTIHYDS